MQQDKRVSVEKGSQAVGLWYMILLKKKRQSDLGKKWYDELQEIVNYRKVYSLLLFHKSLETIVMRWWLEISVTQW